MDNSTDDINIFSSILTFYSNSSMHKSGIKTYEQAFKIHLPGEVSKCQTPPIILLSEQFKLFHCLIIFTSIYFRI